MTAVETNRIDWAAVKRKLQDAQAALECDSSANDARLQTLYRQRAERLARGKDRVRTAQETLPVFAFKLGPETYGIELQHVTKVFPQTIVTPVPGAGDAVSGIANLQGEARSVLDLRRLLGLPAGDADADRYVLLLRQGDARVGLQIEQIDNIRHVPRNDLTAPDAETNERGTHYVQGITHDKLILLNVAALLDPAAATAAT